MQKLQDQNRLKKSFRFFVLVLAISAFWQAMGHFEFFRILERESVDFRMRLVRSREASPSEVAVILIDDSSLRALDPIAGRWPWPRSIHAGLIKFLAACGAKSIVMDIMFTENSNEKDDMNLAWANGEAGNVYNSFQLVQDIKDEYNKGLMDRKLPSEFINRFSISGSGFVSSGNNNYYLPFKELSSASKGMGIVSFSPDHDGVYRVSKLVSAYHGNLFPCLGLAPFFGSGGQSKLISKKNRLTITRMKRKLTIPLTDAGEYYVNIYGKYNIYSYSGVYLTMLKINRGEIRGLPVNPGEFRGKTVFVGVSAAGVEDLKHTPIGEKTPGVFLHASIYGNLLKGDFLEFQGMTSKLAWMLLIVSSFVFSIFYLKTPFRKAFIPVLIISLFWAFALMMFTNNKVINIVTETFAGGSAYVVCFALISFTEGKEKRRIRNILGQYVSPAALAEVLEKGSDEYLRTGLGTRENLTVFFSDIRGFTSLSEEIEVEKVVELLNSYLSAMVNIIFSNQGTLDKFIGDAIVAFWGAPVRREDHAFLAVTAGLSMLQALEELNMNNRIKGLPSLRIGMGIHTGEVILGNIGSEKKLDYTVIGDSVNLTSRLESLTKIYGCPIIISQSTHEEIKNRICSRIVDYVRVKGKSRPILIYSVMGEIGSIDEKKSQLIDLTQIAFRKYRKMDFKGAEEIYRQILEIKYDDSLARLFLGRCASFTANPPQDGWKGCWVYEQK